MSRLRYPELVGKLIGYVVITRKGKYRACIGKTVASEGDDDNLVWAEGNRDARDTLAEALADFDPASRACLAHVFEVPIKVDMMGVWQLVLESAEELGCDPAEHYRKQQENVG